VTYQKIERGRGLAVAKEGGVADGNHEYAIGNDGNDEPLAEGDNDKEKKYAKDGDIMEDNEYSVGDGPPHASVP
jgi:hypothetical protein